MKNTPDDLIKRLRAGGERLTPQRRAVIQALVAGDHLSIQTLQARIAQAEGIQLSETTIYRVLEWLKAVGVVSQTDMGAPGNVYSLVAAPLHHHLICLSCGAVTRLDDRYLAALRQQIQTDFRFTPRIEHMAIYGQCERCAARSSSPADDS